MRVNVTKPFPYSPHGWDNAQADAGEQELPDHIATVAIAEGWASAIAPKAPTAPTHTLNAKQAIELVAEAADVAALEVLRAGEEQHPEYAGGRASVLRAIDERLAELKAAGADTGSSGGGEA